MKLIVLTSNPCPKNALFILGLMNADNTVEIIRSSAEYVIALLGIVKLFFLKICRAKNRRDAKTPNEIMKVLIISIPTYLLGQNTTEEIIAVTRRT